MNEDAKAVRLQAFEYYENGVEILVKIGTKRFPLTVAAAKGLRDRLCLALGNPQ